MKSCDHVTQAVNSKHWHEQSLIVVDWAEIFSCQHNPGLSVPSPSNLAWIRCHPVRLETLLDGSSASSIVKVVMLSYDKNPVRPCRCYREARSIDTSSRDPQKQFSRELQVRRMWWETREAESISQRQEMQHTKMPALPAWGKKINFICARWK